MEDGHYNSTHSTHGKLHGWYLGIGTYTFTYTSIGITLITTVPTLHMDNFMHDIQLWIGYFIDNFVLRSY